MSDHSNSSRSSSRSSKQDSWYRLTMEEEVELVSSPIPSPRRSSSSSSSRASSRANSASSTPRQTQNRATSSAAQDKSETLQERASLSQHPILEEGSPKSVTMADSAERSLRQENVTRDVHEEVISPLVGEHGDLAEGSFHVPPIVLDESQTSEVFGDQLKSSADITGGITRERMPSPFVDDDEGTVISSDTDIPIPFSDADDTDGNADGVSGGVGGSIIKDVVQEAIAEVSADFVSGVLSMSISQQSLENTKAEENEEMHSDTGNAQYPTKEDIPERYSSTATTPWQSEADAAEENHVIQQRFSVNRDVLQTSDGYMNERQSELATMFKEEEKSIIEQAELSQYPIADAPSIAFEPTHLESSALNDVPLQTSHEPQGQLLPSDAQINVTDYDKEESQGILLEFKSASEYDPTGTSGSTRSRSSLGNDSGRTVDSISNESPRPKIKPSSEDKTRGSPVKLPLDLDSLQPLDVEGHVAAGADIVILRGSKEDYKASSSEHEMLDSDRSNRLLQESYTHSQPAVPDEAQTLGIPSPREQNITIRSSGLSSRSNLPHSADSASSRSSFAEDNISRNAQTYIQYPAELQSTSPGAPQSDEITTSHMSDQIQNRHHKSELEDTNSPDITRSVPELEGRHESDGDLLARRVALLLQVNGGNEFNGVDRAGHAIKEALLDSASSSNTGSPDSIEEATLPPGILARGSATPSSVQRREDVSPKQTTSRSTSSGSSYADSLAEHVQRLLQESESLRKLHEAGIDTHQLLNIYEEVGKSSPTVSEASTSSSVRNIINRIMRHTQTDSESDEGMARADEDYLSPSPTVSGSTSIPVGSCSSRSESMSSNVEPVHNHSDKVTFQQTFQASRLKDVSQSNEASRSAESTLTGDSLSQRVQLLLDNADYVDESVLQQSKTKEELSQFRQVAELEKSASSSRTASEKQFSIPATQSSRVRQSPQVQMLPSREGSRSAASGQDQSLESADSLAWRVQAILGKEAPGERVDRIISEALSGVESTAMERDHSNTSWHGSYTDRSRSPQSVSQKTPSPRRSDTPDVALRPTASSSVSLGSVAGIANRPYGAFDRARDMLTLHLQRAADRTFDHSIDTRTPFRQDTNANVIMNVGQLDQERAQAYGANNSTYSSQNISQQLSERDLQSQSSHSLIKPISSEHVFYGLLPDKIPSHLEIIQDQSLGEFHPLPMEMSPTKRKASQVDIPLEDGPQPETKFRKPRETNENLHEDDVTDDLDDSLFVLQRSNSSPEINVGKKKYRGVAKTVTSSHQRSGSWGRPSEFQQLQQSERLPAPAPGILLQRSISANERQHTLQDPPLSQTPQHLPSQQQPVTNNTYNTNSWPRSLSKSSSKGSSGSKSESRAESRTRSRQSMGKDPYLSGSILKPYRPPGSPEVLYTYPVGEEGALRIDGSPAISSTTMESTHTGSDDAQPPFFPASAYGSRDQRDSSGISPQSSKIPRYDGRPGGPSSKIASERSDRSEDVQKLVSADEIPEYRRYRRSLSDGRQEVTDKQKGVRPTSLSPQGRQGRTRASPSGRTIGLKREHSRSPPESDRIAERVYVSGQPADTGSTRSRQQRTDSYGSGRLPQSDNVPIERFRRRESPERFGFRSNATTTWESSRPVRQVGTGGVYPPDVQFGRQVPTYSSRTNLPPTAITSSTKTPRVRQAPTQDPMQYLEVRPDREQFRTRSDNYQERAYHQYGSQYASNVPQLPGTYSRQVLQGVLQEESDPRYKEASLMWDQYQRLQHQKESRREVKEGDESSMSSLDSRRVNRLVHLVNDPVKHTVEQFVQDETDTGTNTTTTDSETPRQRRRWDKERPFTPREQSPEKMARPKGSNVPTEELAAILQTSPPKESRIPRPNNRQNDERIQHIQEVSKSRKDYGRNTAKRPPVETSTSTSTIPQDTTEETISEMATIQDSLLSDVSLESDRLLQLLGPHGIRKLSSKLVKLQRKIDRQREHHRKREGEKTGDDAKGGAARRKGSKEPPPYASTPALDGSLSSAPSTTLEEVSGIINGHHRLAKQASLEPALSPVQETSVRSSSSYDTTESTLTPKVPLTGTKVEAQGRVKKHQRDTKLESDAVHQDDIGVTYTTDSYSDTASDVSAPCSCRPIRSHSVHEITHRAKVKTTDDITRQTKKDIEADDVFRDPQKHLSRIPVRDTDISQKTGSSKVGGKGLYHESKNGAAFVIDMSPKHETGGTDNVLMRRQDDNSKERVDDEDRRRREKKRVKTGQEKSAKENEAPTRIPKIVSKPVAWFQPLSKKMPWQQDTPTKARPQPMSFPAKGDDEGPKPPAKTTLQEAFESHRSDFISKSRERQKKVKLAAEERHLQAQYELERHQIFQDQRSKKPNPNAHPLSDQLHKPKKRAISRKQMRQQTEKVYNRLPEVQQKEKEKKKLQTYETNRLKAQLYRKKLSEKVKSKPWSGN